MLGVQSQEFSEPQWGQEDDEDYGWGDEEFTYSQPTKTPIAPTPVVPLMLFVVRSEPTPG